LIILGIDPGIASTGYGIIEITEDDSMIMLDCGVITTSVKDRHEVRLRQIYDSINGIIKKYKPGAVAIESIFYSKNLKALTHVSEAIGVISLAVGNYGINIKKITPLEVKAAVGRSGRADKKQIQLVVKEILKLDTLPKNNHASDALAIAICYYPSQGYLPPSQHI
jgi:crossover junction endodeoxyribonuclease RuvC